MEASHKGRDREKEDKLDESKNSHKEPILAPAAILVTLVLALLLSKLFDTERCPKISPDLTVLYVSYIFVYLVSGCTLLFKPP